ncbi:SH2 domain-containing protein [Heterostelium album PN500]|uniref:non-specific serine/threonine protein kinase n=1 Tax=Heterostelium pallidum (strain ATCC 26659 / Pp 5 / PN500) TaxID=670386 RepID=D3BVR3_HETP5|nr:SH2 domain-containing protein [Heterostelium album PN500]EFA74566.1 SH2 domain-containing protein [Heterostelium album PN500]|eukprot:XP_020426700.1 SH2 domain-containing protein [Heterostelium album PN500]
MRRFFSNLFRKRNQQQQQQQQDTKHNNNNNNNNNHNNSAASGNNAAGVNNNNNNNNQHRKNESPSSPTHNSSTPSSTSPPAIIVTNNQHDNHHHQHNNNNNNNNNNNTKPTTFTPGITPKTSTPNTQTPPDSPRTKVSTNDTSIYLNGAHKDTNKHRKSNGGEYTPLDYHDASPKVDHSNLPKRKASGPPEILPEEIEYDLKNDFLGQGSFGSVYKGRCRGQEVAVKVPRKQKLNLYELTSFRHEVKIMSKIFHPNVVLFLGACTQAGKMQIVTELCQTDLERLLHNDRTKQEFSLFRRMQMAKDAALGMNWLHGITRIVHNDLKTANLLIDSNLRVKVTDFGFSQIKEGEEFQDKAAKGTPLWMAPEVMMGNPYNEKADVYSFGIILWEILTKEAPYSHHKDYDIFFNAVCNEKERPPIPLDTLPSLKHLILSCWDHNPAARPFFPEILFRLNEILVDCAIEFDEGRRYWKEHFLVPKQELQEEVEWIDFEKSLKSVLQTPGLDYSALKELLVQQSHQTVQKTKHVVTMERFDKVMKWFGSFFEPQIGAEIINNINKLSGKMWFHGDISREQATARLLKESDGSFLIRLSSTEPKSCPFTLSMKNDQHRRIQLIDDNSSTGFKIQGKTAVYNSLIELVEKCSDYPLTKACPKHGQEIEYHIISCSTDYF